MGAFPVASRGASMASADGKFFLALRDKLLVAGGVGFLLLWLLSGFYMGFVFLVCLGSLAYAADLTAYIMDSDAGTSEMTVIADAIREGAEGFLQTQYGAIMRVSGIVTLLLVFLYLVRPGNNEYISRFSLAIITAVGFMLGAFCSALAGAVGVWISVRCNVRVSSAAARHKTGEALKLAFCGGAVSSIISAAMCILGIALLYSLLHLMFVSWGAMPAHMVPLLLVGYGFGASFVALFMQLGGGIYTKAADVGADMVGKVESNIPEDDHRNPATIADLVGDNVGDCAGSMADVFESIAAEIIGTMIHASALAKINATNSDAMTGYILFPLMVHAFDLIVSSVGVALLRSASETECEDPLKVMQRAYVAAAALALVSYLGITASMLSTAAAPGAWASFFLCGLIGIASAYALIFITQYYTDYQFEPVKGIARASVTGHGTNVIAGLAVGFESTGLPALIIALTLLGSYTLGERSGLAGHGVGMFGVACATMGMLGTAVFIMAMNNFGPIADNAGGIVEMSQQPDAVRDITDRLDAVGNVTKAATKGYAVGGSALATFILFRAYLDEVAEFTGKPFDTVNIAKVEVLIGGLLGIAMIFVFVGWSMKAVGVTAQAVVKEVRRQFKEFPGILENTQKPEYGQCVRIVTQAALQEMVKPALLALLTPVGIGVVAKFVGSITGQSNLAPEVVN